MKPPLDTVRREYVTRYASLRVPADRQAEIAAIVQRITQHRARYEEVSRASKNALSSGVPWQVIGVIHSLECDGRFDQHLHNGDPLARPTVNEPAHLPTNWLRLPADQRTWEASALDALAYDHFLTWHDWSLPGALYMLEAYNGWGYRSHDCPTPYLWAATQHYTAGKYIADGRFDPTAVSKQIGAAPLLQSLGFC